MAKTFYNNDLINAVAEHDGITKVEAERRIKLIFGIIGDKLAEMGDGDAVKLANFFNFHVKVRKPKKGKNPATGEDMVIPATKTIVTKPTKSMKDKIRGE
jgi:DNA-binding protein HU-beta